MNKLYVRIWLAVVLAVAVLTLLVGWAWRMAADPPLRDVVVRNQAGDVVGQGQARMGRAGAAYILRESTEMAQSGSDNAVEPLEPKSRPTRNGPEFEVRMRDGQTLHVHLPRPPQTSWRAPFGFFWTLGLVAVAVALATYPIVRRLTRRLEALRQSVQQWGEGDLSVRVPEGGRDEIGFLASRFNRAAQQIEALVQARDALLASQKSLLANASHELRSPLARIRMGMELMGHTSDGSEVARQEIARNIGELDQLIEEILLASRLDAREADMGTVEPVDLVGLIAEECALTDAALEVPPGQSELVVPGVAKLLRRAVRNLLENARRYGAGEVTVKLSEEGAMAVIAVCDRGPGVPEGLQSRIFEPFYRLPGASEREGGVGLGLALVRAIALRHAGSVQCGNQPQGGACFELRLPINGKTAP
jgi:signal transduction histidine kinase